MKKIVIIAVLIAPLSIPSVVPAIEIAERITDREIVERLTRLEEGQNTLRAEIKANTDAIKQLREDMRQLREDMNSQFNRIAGIFTALVVAVIGFAIWDRRTMTRPFEVKVKKIEDEITENRIKLNDLLNAFKTLGKTDKEVAEILKRFNLL